MNDLIEALKNRINSPVFGYFVLALLAFNWKAFFYMAVQKGDALIRIQFFEQNTTTFSILIWPLAFAIGFAVCYPWLTFVVIWLTARPTELKDLVQANSEHRLLVRKKQLEDARSSLLANAELELIERAKRDQELDNLQNENLRKKLKSELELLRTERDSLRETQQSAPPLVRHKELMDLANSYRSRAENPSGSISDRERFYTQARQLEDQAFQMLKMSGVLQDSNA